MRQDRLTLHAPARQAAAIRHARSAQDIEQARALFVEYAAWLQVDLCVQGFEAELATLPGAYAPPRGCLLLAGPPGAAFGCIALRPLDAAARGGSGAMAAAGATSAEVKRLYVRAAQRGAGWGKRLACAVRDEARAMGYRELKLDTLAWMTAARALYAELGFRECAAYYDSALAGTVYMALAL